jgi:adenosylcobinamide kinase/adenosylcobinamide-phosphate guanylyltransferase
MARIVLVTGGCRSGKSAHALELAHALPGTRAYVATCPITDEELARRVAAHRRSRDGQGWTTIEEQVELAEVFRRNAGFDVLLVECVTLWVNNLMYRAEQQGGELTEADIEAPCRALLDAAAACRGIVIFVTNEVGLGIVPDNPLARRYRDLVGRANQLIAARADIVMLVCAGIPLQLKPNMKEPAGR